MKKNSLMMLRYIERKTGYHDDGPAWVGFVKLSRSGRTVYFNGRAFKRATVGSSGNHYDIETGDGYWISGVKKDGSDRHRCGSGKITIEAAAVDAYLKEVGASKLDASRFVVSDAIEPADPSKFVAAENEPLP